MGLRLEIINRIKGELYRRRFRNCSRQSIHGKEIVFHDVWKSNLLIQIAGSGWQSYEPEMAKFFKFMPFEFRTFVDGGANVGFFSALARMSPHQDITVIAVEPFPENVAYLKKFRKNNDISFHVEPFALDDENEKEVELYYPVEKTSSILSAAASMNNSFDAPDGSNRPIKLETIKVKTKTLAAVFGANEYPALVKLDCEGNELAILKSSIDITGRSDVDVILEIRINDDYRNDVFNVMVQNGYDAYLMTDGGFVHEDRPLTFPVKQYLKRTLWRNHYFTKRSRAEIRSMSEKIYGYFI